MSKGLAIIMFSGEAEKFIPLAALTQTAANLGVPVKIFVSGYATLYFTKNKPEPKFTKEFEEYAPKLLEGMQKLNMPSWYDILKEAKETGEVKIYVCSLTAQAMGLKKEDLDPIVDDMVGATFFMMETDGYQVIFI
ncbi:MAG: DsrE/DsrF/DrsH-like family protein [Desulfurococcales archaeon]|nr:DsrE/DsrF/DrsH-like family protein [Desulfurococcales archaeon]